MPEIVLKGCTPEPLMSYLKALGVLRLVAEQKDPGARGCWRNGEFVLRTQFDEAALVEFFIDEYHPTPIVVPWSGGDFFGVDRAGNPGPFKKTPSSSQIIEAFLAVATSPRLAEYGFAINSALASLDACGISEKKSMEDKRAKTRFISHFRSTVTESVAKWIDAASVLGEEKTSFNSILGSGGGSDGNTHFSDNFMQNLWEMLPDFAPQRSPRYAFVLEESISLLRSAMLGRPTDHLVSKRTSALFDGGAVGGQNAGQGLVRDSLGNPWGVILCLEGTMLLAGALTTRQDASSLRHASFPFLARLTPTKLDSTAEKETAGREAWLPLWSKWTSLVEIGVLFSEGRASVGGKRAENGVDFARAVTSLGVDRGIDSFCRYAIVRGRVGGDNYNTSTPLGRFSVEARADVDLIREIDPWLDRFRYAASDDKAPPRFKSALRGIESAIFEFCQYGGTERFGEILRALGRAERELATGEKFRDDKNLRPLAGLSPEWIRAANDGSVELELALALACIWDSKLGALRANLEPIAAWIDKKGRPLSKWLEKDRAVVWSSADLAKNLAAILGRRVMDAGRRGCEQLPVASRRSASLDAVAAFIAGEADDARIGEWLWGLSLVDHSKEPPRIDHWRSEDAPLLPRSYALLKLLFLPYELKNETGAIEIKPEARVLPLVRAGRVDEACSLALRRLRTSGFVPMPRSRGANRDDEWKDAKNGVDASLLAAALLLPVSKQDAGRLAGLIARPDVRTDVAVD